MGSTHPTDRQREFFDEHVAGADSTILTLKHTHEEARGFAINVRGPFKLATYPFEGAPETVIDAEWAGPPESQSHLHCCWTEVRFALLTETSAKVRENIGYDWQLAFFASWEDAIEYLAGKGSKRLFWFYLKDKTHKAVVALKQGEVVDLTGEVGAAEPGDAAGEPDSALP